MTWDVWRYVSVPAPLEEPKSVWPLYRPAGTLIGDSPLRRVEGSPDAVERARGARLASR